MATDTMSTPATGNTNMAETQDAGPEYVQVAAADGTPANGAPAAQQNVIPGAPNGEVHVTVPADQTVVRVQVAPGETIDLPFDGSMAAKFGEQGNLAVKVGDQTIILLGYAAANQQEGVTLHDSHGHPIDVASVVAQTDPNLDIQTAAGPAAGPAGGTGGHLFFGFDPGSGLGGLGELGVIDPTQLQYKLIAPDEQIRPFALALSVSTTDHTLTITSSDGGANSLTEILTHNNSLTGDSAIGNYLISGNVEGKAINPALVTGVDGTNNSLTTSVDSHVTVNFVSEQAQNHNIVGVYTYDNGGNITGVQFVWLDASTSGGSLVTDILGNSQPGSVDIGNIPGGSHIGFFLLENGAGNATDIATLLAAAGGGGHGYATDLATLNSKTSIVVDGSGIGHVVVDGTELSSTVVFTSSTGLNADHGQHAVSGITDPSTGQLYVGFEDKPLDKSKQQGGGDKDYNDVIFGVDLGGVNTSKNDHQVFSPQIKLGDSAEDVNSMHIVTSGFLLGDTLNHLADANGFHVDVTKNGNDYDIHITETTPGHTDQQWQDFVNNIEFVSSSPVDGSRSIDYTVGDSAGHSATTTANINVTSVHHESLSTENDAHHPGVALLHNGGTAGHDVAWGNGDDVLYTDTHFTKAGAPVQDGVLDMGAGNNTVHLGATNISFTGDDAHHLKNVDNLDATGYGKNQITLNYNDVIGMADAGTHTVKIDGDSTDTFFLSGDGAGPGSWSKTTGVSLDGQTYTQYDWHASGGAPTSATVLVNDHIAAANQHLNNN